MTQRSNTCEPKSGLPDYYEILKCNRDASTEELKKSYQNLVLSTHPDKVSCHEESFLLIQKAWNILRNFESRKVYDAQLASSECNNSDYLLYNIINVSEMDLCDGVYTYLCRCGSNYVLEENERNTSDESIVIECEECSFSLKINLR